MPRKGFTEEQIGVALRQVEAGTAVTDICARLGIAEPTFYRWKRKYAGPGSRWLCPGFHGVGAGGCGLEVGKSGFDSRLPR